MRLCVCGHAANTYGSIYLFKDFLDNMYVTVSLDARPNGQPFFTLPNAVTGLTGTASMLATTFASSIGTGQLSNYVDQVGCVCVCACVCVCVLSVRPRG